MNKLIKALFGLILLSVILVSGWMFLENKKIKVENSEGKTKLGECYFNLEKAEDEESRKKGLSGRESLCQDCGMLFIFPKESLYSFWMKDMKFPIDIVWLKNNEVVEINQNIDSQSKKVYTSKEKIDRVLEINANDVDRCKIKKGDKLKY